MTAGSSGPAAALTASRDVTLVDDAAFFGDVLRRLCDERGLSVRRLGEEINQSKSVAHAWMQGKYVPNLAEAERIDKLLGAGGALAAAAQMPGANGAADRIAHVARKPRSVDPATVAALTGVLANMRRLEDSMGAERLIVVTAEPFRLVEDLADEAAGDIRTAVVDLAGQWAQFAGWLRAAAGRPADARELYGRTMEHATEAGNEDLIATALSMRGNLAWHARQPGAVVGLSAAAAEKGRSPGIRAMARQQEARGHALMGNVDAVNERFDDATELMAEAVRRSEDEPPWIYFYSPGYLDMQRGLADSLLGRKDDAIAKLTAGLEAMGGDVRGSEFVANYVLQLAEIHAEAGNPDLAEQLLGQVRAVIATTGSPGLRVEAERLTRLLHL